MSAEYGLPLDPGRRVGELSAGERQRVEVVRCLLQEPRLLIMDEPTSVLTPQEAETLFATLRRLAEEGTGVLYISHKLGEIRALCERATILRRGRVVGRCDPREATAQELAERMVGPLASPPARPAAAPGPLRLEVEGLDLPAATPLGTSLRGVSLSVRAGEVLGVGGVAGNGQDELLAALSGERRAAAGAIRLDSAPVGHLGPARRRALGLLAAPEERLGHASAPEMSLVENALLTGCARRGLARRGVIDWGRARAFAEEVIEAFDVRTPGPGHAARALSGGNLQRFVIGREILQEPGVLVVNQPTWGVDAAAAAGDPPGARGPRRARRRRGRHQPGPRRADGDRRLLLRPQRRQVEPAAPHGRPDPRRDRPDAGRRERGGPGGRVPPAGSPRGSAPRSLQMIRLEPRPEPSRAWALAVPPLAVC